MHLPDGWCKGRPTAAEVGSPRNGRRIRGPVRRRSWLHRPANARHAQSRTCPRPFCSCVVARARVVVTCVGKYVECTGPPSTSHPPVHWEGHRFRVLKDDGSVSPPAQASAPEHPDTQGKGRTWQKYVLALVQAAAVSGAFSPAGSRLDRVMGKRATKQRCREMVVIKQHRRLQRLQAPRREDGGMSRGLNGLWSGWPKHSIRIGEAKCLGPQRFCRPEPAPPPLAPYPGWLTKPCA